MPANPDVKEFMQDLALKLNITSLDGWYNVPTTTLHKFGASSLLKKYNSFLALLSAAYPQYLFPRIFLTMHLFLDIKKVSTTP